jgi:DNA-directed RNA polymerase specialized sigma24 family protein
LQLPSHTVVNNTLTDYWRRQQGKPERGGVGGSAFLERLASVAQLGSPEAVNELSVAIERQAHNSAAEVIARVQARLKETTWQAFYQTLALRRPAKEVAQALGVTVSTVYKDTYRVKLMLQEEYRHVHPSDQGIPLPGRADAAAVPQ